MALKSISIRAGLFSFANFYTLFLQVEYHNFTEVFKHAASSNKLVHSILLWGALDDQSC